MNAAKETRRIIGYDFARALAIMGMVIVNFALAMEAEANGPTWLQQTIHLMEGRAAATFVILAGVGLSLFSQKARLLNDTDRLAKHRYTLWKRALFLFVIGLLYTQIWPPDILHFYGLYIAIGACLLTVQDRTLWKLALGSIFVFTLLLFIFDYDAGWNWAKLEYLDFWTVQGMLRHMFFNGFHPVFPWIAFLFVGMWLGRQDLTKPATRIRLMIYCAGIFLVTESLSWLLTQMVKAVTPQAELIDALALVDLQAVPPMPFYMFSAGSVAIIIILLSITFTQKYSGSYFVKALVLTGQLALTMYIAHVIVGMGLLEVLGFFENQSLGFAVLIACIFYTLSVGFSILWRKRMTHGPLELVMRKMT
jgi:uncharacterized membrane protein YeiB